MERTLIAYSLMALMIVAGIVIGLYLRHNSRERWLQRSSARKRLERQSIALSAGANRLPLKP